MDSSWRTEDRREGSRDEIGLDVTLEGARGDMGDTGATGPGIGRRFEEEGHCDREFL